MAIENGEASAPGAKLPAPIDNDPAANTPIPPLRGRQLWWTWCRWSTAGEAVGFCAPAVAGAAVAEASAAFQLPVLVAAGAVEGAVLGMAQAHVVTRAIRGLSWARWVIATALAAGLAWIIGMFPVLFGSRLGSLPMVVVLVVGLAGGSVMLLSIGTAQWWVLRARVAGSSRWIAGTAAAWLAGLGVFCLVAMPLWHPGQSGLVIAAIGALAGILMAATVAVVTGLVLVRLLADK